HTAEAYSSIRSNIEFRTKAGTTLAIVVTSSESGEGKSITAANLSIIMARAGLQTLLIDADMRRPSQHQLFKLPAGGGLSDAIQLAEGEGLNLVRPSHIPNLSVMTSGRTTNN